MQNQNLERPVPKSEKIRTDLFTTAHTNVFVNLENENVWTIDNELRNIFDVQGMYQQVMQENIPWRQSDEWIKQQVITYYQ